MEVKGSVADRPWGMTLGAIALRRHTGQLTIESDGKRYGIAFDDGAIVGAASPLAADAIARIALTNHFITSTQVTDLTRRLAMSADRDEVDVLADAIRCSPEQTLKLRHRLVAQRAARTFSIERGDFVLDDRIALPVFPGVSIDHRHVIYLGVRTNLSEQRLIDDLRELGAFFVLKPEAIDELPRFGFEPSAHPVIEALKVGTSLPELEASHRELDPRFAQAIIYALVSCAACVISPRTATTTRPGVGRTATPSPRAQGTAATLGPRTQTSPAAARPRTKTPPTTPLTYVAPGTAASPGGRTTTSPFASRATLSPTAYAAAAPEDTGTNTPAATRSRPQSDPGRARTPATGRTQTPATGRTQTPAASTGRTQTPTAPATGRVQTPAPAPGSGRTGIPVDPPDASASDTVRTAAVSEPTAPSTGRADTDDNIRFSEIPTPSPLPPSAKRAATFGEPQPTRASSASSSPGGAPTAIPRALTPSDAEMARGFAEQRTPTDRTPGFGDQRTPSEHRTPTEPSLARTPTGSPVPSRVPTDNAVAAEAAFKRGELAMKRDQPGDAILEFKAACDLNPAEVDYAGMLAWAKFCAAGDKPAVGAETRKLLERAVFKSQRPERARFYLGRVERMLGRDKEALRHFQEVLDLKPNHAEAASEVRAIEARLQSSKGTGLFGRKK
jgi:uncharacterized protein DUF4388